MEAVVSSARHQFSDHVGGRSVPAAVQLCAADEKQGFCDMAFPCARVAGDHKPLFASYKIHLCNLHHLGLIYSGLESKVVVGEKFSLGKP